MNECDGNGTNAPPPPMTSDLNGWREVSVPSTSTAGNDCTSVMSAAWVHARRTVDKALEEEKEEISTRANAEEARF